MLKQIEDKVILMSNHLQVYERFDIGDSYSVEDFRKLLAIEREYKRGNDVQEHLNKIV